MSTSASTSRAWYNDSEPYVSDWARNLIKAGLVMDGDVDGRPIQEVQPADLKGYRRCHFFSGILGWDLALQLAGWPLDREVWTGSCPCQPFSVAGKRLGAADTRHLWPEWFRLIKECKPAAIFGEQVASKAGLKWLDSLFADLESVGYAVAGADLPAYSKGYPHQRRRLYFTAYTSMRGRERLQQCPPEQIPKDRPPETLGAWDSLGNPFQDWRKLLAETRIDKLDDGVSSMLVVRPSLKAIGNSIVPQVAAEFIKAVLSALDEGAL